jgi:cold shock CspA family protein
MRKTGKVKSLKPTFGFIRADDGADLFFLPTAMDGVEFSRLKENQPVEFEEVEHAKGRRATKIKVVE